MTKLEERLIKKRLDVLAEIKPICEVFGIGDYDYLIIDGFSERLRIYDTQIGCTSNSISAVVDELIGYIFITKWCSNRSLGAFSKQAQNAIKRHWIEQEC